MTDDLTIHGLGAQPEVPDERDFPIDALYAAEGMEPTDAASLPATFAAAPMPAVLDQGSTGRCVAFSSSTMRAWQDRRDQERWFDFDEATFFFSIGGTDAAGANTRDAMVRMKDYGYPIVGTGDAGKHKIAAYYALPIDRTAIKQAIHDFGPIVVSTAWYRSWFHPNSAGVLPAPDTQVGGHAIVAYGWDDAKGLRLRNSWGADWGVNGDCYMPWAQVAKLRFAWKTVDAIEHPIPWVHVYATTADLRLRATPSTAAAKVSTIPRGKSVGTSQLEKYGGKYTGPSGAARTDWLRVTYGGRTGWIARGYTRLVK